MRPWFPVFSIMFLASNIWLLTGLFTAYYFLSSEVFSFCFTKTILTHTNLACKPITSEIHTTKQKSRLIGKRRKIHGWLLVQIIQINTISSTKKSSNCSMWPAMSTRKQPHQPVSLPTGRPDFGCKLLGKDFDSGGLHYIID